MNWDRVRSENRAQLHGSEHVDTASRVLTATGQVAPPVKTDKKRKGKKKGISRTGRVMPDCTCGKRIGFTGQHKSECPLRNKEGRPLRIPCGV